MVVIPFLGVAMSLSISSLAAQIKIQRLWCDLAEVNIFNSDDDKPCSIPYEIKPYILGKGFSCDILV